MFSSYLLFLVFVFVHFTSLILPLTWILIYLKTFFFFCFYIWLDYAIGSGRYEFYDSKIVTFNSCGQVRSFPAQLHLWQLQERGWIPFKVMATWQIFSKNTTTLPFSLWILIPHREYHCHKVKHVFKHLKSFDVFFFLQIITVIHDHSGSQQYLKWIY